jgi:hypothetical protein
MSNSNRLDAVPALMRKQRPGPLTCINSLAPQTVYQVQSAAINPCYRNLVMSLLGALELRKSINSGWYLLLPGQGMGS